MAEAKQTPPTHKIRNQAIAYRMRELREGLGLSQENFAFTYGLGRASYWRAETGKTNITMKLLYQVVDAHGMSLAEFFAPLKESYPKEK